MPHGLVSWSMAAIFVPRRRGRCRRRAYAPPRNAMFTVRKAVHEILYSVYWPFEPLELCCRIYRNWRADVTSVTDIGAGEEFDTIWEGVGEISTRCLDIIVRFCGTDQETTTSFVYGDAFKSNVINTFIQYLEINNLAFYSLTRIILVTVNSESGCSRRASGKSSI